MFLKLIIFIGLHCTMYSIDFHTLTTALPSQKSHPFLYDLHSTVIAGKRTDAPVMICCHGYGSNYTIARAVSSWNVVPDHIIGFNFPDYDLRNYDPKKSTFGSIQEILPLLYMIKKCVIDAGLESINLYGFSAGGGAIINAFAVLNQTMYDEQLKKIGIDSATKTKILAALQKGHIILDCPLKSIDELMDLRGNSPEFAILADRYRHNNMRPIDSVALLQGLNLTVFLHFQTPDDIINNRDDALFIERLRKANKGVTEVVLAQEGGHNAFHTSLWRQYEKFRKAK